MSYAAVGAFVILLGSALVAALLWIAAGGRSQQQTDLYRAIENESVAGLNVDAAVKLSGVDIGSVRSIELDPANPQQVRLLLAIRRGTPIRADAEAMLKTQGLTGIAYVEVTGGSPAAALLQPSDERPYPVIRTKPSLSARLENVLGSALAKLDSTTARLDAILSPANEAALSSTLADLASLAHVLAAHRASLGAGIDSAAATFANGRRLTAQLAPVIERVGKAADDVAAMSLAAGQASDRAASAATAVGGAAQHFGARTLPELQRLLTELQALSATLQRVGEQVERNPSSLLLGSSPVADGPGEAPQPAPAP